MYQFLSDEYETRFEELCNRDNTHFGDSERRALFFIIAGNNTLYQNIGKIYDFDENAIKLEALSEPFLTSGIRGLIELAFSLYGSGTCDVRQLFNQLDYQNGVLAIEAIRSRFKIMNYPDCNVL